MDEELGLLESAYGALQRGDAEAALASARGHAERFPDGALAQEREVLAIDALMRLNRRTEADARANAFRTRYPTSTHWIRIQGLLSGTRP
jgi:outer membrane protein assembly factor BamD (BamD/ComL family)